MTDWLANRLTVSGPPAEVEGFRGAAQGTGAVPWHLDLDFEEARLLAPMASAGPAAKTLARCLREVIARRHDRVLRHDCVLRHGHQPGGCPLDLHRLIPVPSDILGLGETHPAAQAWLWANWGTISPLRHARLLEENADRRLRRSARVTYAFHSADWTPWQALLRLRRDWTKLVLAIEPRYGDG